MSRWYDVTDADGNVVGHVRRLSWYNGLLDRHVWISRWRAHQLRRDLRRGRDLSHWGEVQRPDDEDTP